MPLTQPAGTELFLSKQGGMFVPVILVDIQTLDCVEHGSQAQTSARSTTTGMFRTAAFAS